MTKMWKRVGATGLAFAMSLSLVLGNVPALAAPGTGGATTYTRPELVMDFLGDNKGGYGAANAGYGDKTVVTPATSSVASVDHGADGKWDGYVNGDQSTTLNSATQNPETIFWMGIGIKDVDQFILANGGKGLYSAELALYYNPEYVYPLTSDLSTIPNVTSYQDLMEKYNLGSTAKNQWSASDYTITALTDLDPVNDPVNMGIFSGSSLDPTVNEGYGTEEFSAPSGWKMTYVSVEKTDPTGSARFDDSNTYNDDDTYYIAMVPFVLKGYDPANELCIRLALNASMFSIGSAETSGTSGEGAGSVEYGNWDKYTYHDPDHDLKLMFDYTGDLNIFTNEHEPINTEEARLSIINPDGVVTNTAELFIDNEPFAPPPSQLANTSGDKITNLSGGEQLRVKVHAENGYGATVIVKDDAGNVVATSPASPNIGATDTNRDMEVTFIMPTLPPIPGGVRYVTVEVIFTGGQISNQDLDVTLNVLPDGYHDNNNHAQLRVQGGNSTGVVYENGTDFMTANANTTVEISINRNSDYDVEVKAYLTSNSTSTVTVTKVTETETTLTYKFTMPGSAVTVDVKFTLAPKYKVTLQLDGADGLAGNWGRLSFTNGSGVVEQSDKVTGANANTSGLINYVESRDNRVITITTGCAPGYQINMVVASKNGNATVTIPVTATGTNGQYAFKIPSPGYDIDVKIYFTTIQKYKVRLVLKDTISNEGAVLSTQASGCAGSVTLDHDTIANATASGQTLTDSMNVFAGVSMNVAITGLTTGRTATVKVVYPQEVNYSDTINVTGSAAAGFNFTTVALNNAASDEIVVIVTFQAAPSTPLIAYIDTVEVDENNIIVTGTNPVYWQGTTISTPITAYENDRLGVDITVKPGWYISAIRVYNDTLNEHYQNGNYGVRNSPIGVPVTLSGIGYNNGQGGSETAYFDMPGEDAHIYIEFTEGVPPVEPEFTVTLLANGNGSYDPNNFKLQKDTDPAVNGPCTISGVTAGTPVYAYYMPASGSYVSNVTVTASVPGTTVTWNYALTNGTPNTAGIINTIAATMPGANLVITVTFTQATGTPYDLTIQKAETPGDEPDNKITTATATTTPAVVVYTIPVSGTVQAYDGEQVAMRIDVKPGYHIESVTTANGTPVTLSGTGYHNGQGGSETAVLTMPAFVETVTVTFKQGAPDPSLTFVVTEPSGAGNTINVPGNTALGAADSPYQVSSSDMPSVGDTVTVKINAQPGYSVDQPVLTTPNGLVNIVWTATDEFTFIMPSEPLTVTVPFKAGDPDQFQVNLVLRHDNSISNADWPDILAEIQATLKDTDYSRLDSGVQNYIYAHNAQPGEQISFTIRLPNGYFISAVSVTPASFGITPTITGMMGTQKGGFIMPAGNTFLNITVGKGWPDEATYNQILHVSGATDSASQAEMENVTNPAITGMVHNGSASIIAKDSDLVQVEIVPGTDDVLDSVTVVDGSGNPVTFQWIVKNGHLGIEYNVPGSSVDVYVKFKKDDGVQPTQKVTLHTSGVANSAQVTMSDGSTTVTDNGTITPISALQAVDIVVTANSSTSLIASAYAQASDGSLVSLTPVVTGDPALSGSFANDVDGKTYRFLMPYYVDVDVYVVFRDIPQSQSGEYVLNLLVKGPASSGTATVNEYTVGSPTTGTSLHSMSATATGGNAMMVTGGNTITTKVTAATGYALYSIIAYTSDGMRIQLDLDTNVTPAANTQTYKFTMPANTTHIEVEFRKVEAGETYQIQVVVNNTVNNGLGNNDALLYENGTGTGQHLFMNVTPGTLFDLGLIIESGYQVSSVVAVPQNSGVAANIPPPATSNTTIPVVMPATDLVIYVTFAIDVTTNYNVTAQISYESGVSEPTSGQNTVTITNQAQDDTDTAYSYNAGGVVTNTIGQIQEAQNKWVTAKWSCAPDYVVSSYTVKTVSGTTVMSQPLYDGSGNMIGIEFVMPGEAVVVDVKFTNPQIAPAQTFQAYLHYVNDVMGDYAEISQNSNSTNMTSTDGDSITGLTVGDVIDISATPDTGRYLQTIYVLQNGQMLPLSASNLDTVNPATTSTGKFSMPASDVHVYVVFSATQPNPNDYVATLTVIGPSNAAGSAEMFTTTVNTTGTVGCNAGTGSIVVSQGTLVTVNITVAAGYSIQSVVGTPISPTAVAPQVGNTATVYTFTMPAANTGIVVTLKADNVATKQLNLHVSHVDETRADKVNNETSLSYVSSPSNVDITVAGSGDDSMMVAPGTTVTLTVKPQGPAPTTQTAANPQEGYYVRAAYGVYNNALIALTPVAPRTDPLEGATYDDVTGGTNEATFVMPSGVTDVYVVYEYGYLPDAPWYNIIVTVTDTGGATANTGLNKVLMSSTSAMLGGSGSIPQTPEQTVPSNATPVYYSVSIGETIRVDAAKYPCTNPNYIYDYMNLSVSAPGATVPTLTPDPSNSLGAIQEFVVDPALASPTTPAFTGNIGVHVNFKTVGSTGLWAKLHVVTSSSVPGYPDNTVTLSDGNNSVKNDGNGDTLTNLVSSQTITTTIQPKDPNTRVVKVIVTKDGEGSQIALSSSGSVYTYVMEDKSVHVYVVLADKDDTDRFIAVATPVYDNGVTATGSSGGSTVVNGLVSVENITTSGLNSADYWTEIRGGDRTKTTFKAEAGVYATVTARRADDHTALGVLQIGVGNGSTGVAYVDTPTPGCDVEIFVTFSTTPPAAKELEFISSAHADEVDNKAMIKIDRTTPKNSETLTPPNTVTALADLSYVFKDYTTATPAGDDESVTPGTGLEVTATLATDYTVDKVEVIVHTSSGDMTLAYKMKKDTTTGSATYGQMILVDSTNQPVNLQMPTENTTIKVYFKLDTASLLPYDPDTLDNDNPYKDHWITSENIQGEKLDIIVPMLNNEQGTNPADVEWDYQVKEHRFKFYIKDGSSYTSLMSVIELNRPADAATPGSNDPTEYVLGNYYTDTTVTPNVAYTGARFILTVKTDDEIDNDASIAAADKATAKALAGRLRDIMDNDGTDNPERLYITCEETTYTSGVANTLEESTYVDFEVPRYYSLAGQLESWAPMHVAVFTLTEELPNGSTATPTILVDTMAGEDGQGLWRQNFVIRMTSDLDKLTANTFKLVIEKAAHLTYTHTAISFDIATATADNLYSATKKQFSFAAPIQLLCGDVDNDGMIIERDVDYIIDYIYGYYPWNQVQVGDPNWSNSVYNPDSFAYVVDLDGDGWITEHDIDVMLDVPNYGKTTKAYGSPSGLNNAGGVALYSMEQEVVLLPQWAEELLAAGESLPDWAEEMLAAGETLPDENRDPNAPIEIALPQWAKDLLDVGEALPDWAETMLAAGETLPDENQNPDESEIQLPTEGEILVDNENIPTEEDNTSDITEEVPDEEQENTDVDNTETPDGEEIPEESESSQDEVPAEDVESGTDEEDSPVEDEEESETVPETTPDDEEIPEPDDTVEGSEDDQLTGDEEQSKEEETEPVEDSVEGEPDENLGADEDEISEPEENTGEMSDDTTVKIDEISVSNSVNNNNNNNNNNWENLEKDSEDGEESAKNDGEERK